MIRYDLAEAFVLIENHQSLASHGQAVAEYLSFIKSEFMKTCFLLIYALLAISAANAQQLEQFGLEGKTVTAMHEFFGTLYVTTQDSGVYRRYLADPDSGWIHLGVPAKKLTSTFAFQTICPFVCWKGILAGAVPEQAAGDSTLIYFYQQYPDTCQREGRWIPADSGIDRAYVKQINALAGTAVCQSLGPEFVTAFAAGPGSIYRSLDRGKSWQLVWQKPFASVRTLSAYNRSRRHMTEEEIWAGGALSDGLEIQSTLILRSRDSGTTWDDRSPANLMLRQECRALGVDPADTNLVYAVLSHTVIKSRDAGKTWQVANLTDPRGEFTSVLVNRGSSGHVFVGGSLIGDDIFKLFETRDGGESWTEPFIAGSRKGVTSIVADPFLARDPPPRPEIAYLATLGSGVFVYRQAPLPIEEQHSPPDDFRFEPSFANPGRLTEISALTFRVHAPAADALNILLYNTLGQQIAFWRANVPAGEQDLTLPLASSSLTAGLYFIQAEWRNRVIVKKWTALQ